MRHEAYRVAFDEANWELKEIVGQFDSLAARKEQVEKVVEVLKPFVGFGGQNAGTDPRGGELSPELYQQRNESAANDASRGFGSGPTRGIRLEAYRVAFEEASSELKEFLQRFEQLRYRKEYLERVVDVLKPLAVPGASVAVMDPRPAESEPVYSGEPVPAVPAATEAVSVQPQQEEAPSDPFQRRDAIASGSATKDLRDYSRLFSSLQRR
jgi:hypothetical protein